MLQFGKAHRQVFTDEVATSKMTDPNHCPKVDYGRNINDADVAIIGAGISGKTYTTSRHCIQHKLTIGVLGMCTAIDMIRRGGERNFIIFEKSNQVGGTWNDNVYPGCCCDGIASC